MTAQECRYITAPEIPAYEAEGWEITQLWPWTPYFLAAREIEEES